MSKKAEGNKGHEPVLLEEVLEALHIKEGGAYIDATLGGGGHAVKMVEAGGQVLGIDADLEMIKEAKARVGRKIEVAHGNFRNIGAIAKSHGFEQVEGILFDLGISSIHYNLGRGFSFRKKDERLDMRLDPESQNLTAADLLNSLREDQLEEMFGVVLNRGLARRLARQVREAREEKRIETMGDFLKCLGNWPKKGKLDPATLPLLAIRIAVNGELENLREGMTQAWELLGGGGRMVVISFHSGEDRIVKEMFRAWVAEGKGEMVTKKPVVPGEAELVRNPRARSSKMRVFQKNK